MHSNQIVKQQSERFCTMVALKAHCQEAELPVIISKAERHAVRVSAEHVGRSAVDITKQFQDHLHEPNGW